MTTDIVKEIFEIGKLYGRKIEFLDGIIHNNSLSTNLKVKLFKDYSREFQEKITILSKNIRQKLNITEADSVITYELDSAEIIVLDLNIDKYKRLCEKHNYFVNVIWGKWENKNPLKKIIEIFLNGLKIRLI